MASSSTAAPGAETFGRFCDVPVGPGPESLRLEESMVVDNTAGPRSSASVFQLTLTSCDTLGVYSLHSAALAAPGSWDWPGSEMYRAELLFREADSAAGSRALFSLHVLQHDTFAARASDIAFKRPARDDGTQVYNQDGTPAMSLPGS